MNFEQLIQACEHTHKYLQRTAVSAVNKSLDSQMFVSRYQVQLPTARELEEFIKQDIKALGGN